VRGKRGRKKLKRENWTCAVLHKWQFLRVWCCGGPTFHWTTNIAASSGSDTCKSSALGRANFAGLRRKRNRSLIQCRSMNRASGHGIYRCNRHEIHPKRLLTAFAKRLHSSFQAQHSPNFAEAQRSCNDDNQFILLAHNEGFLPFRPCAEGLFLLLLAVLLFRAYAQFPARQVGAVRVGRLARGARTLSGRRTTTFSSTTTS